MLPHRPRGPLKPDFKLNPRSLTLRARVQTHTKKVRKPPRRRVGVRHELGLQGRRGGDFGVEAESALPHY